MRRLVSGGVLLSLALLAAHSAVESWVEARAVIELERLSRTLPDGGRLVWTHLDVKPLQLALDLEGIRLDLPPGGAVRQLTLGAVRLAQAGGGVDSIGRIGAVRARDVVIRLADDAGTLRIGLLEGDAVEIEALTNALAGPDPLAGIQALRLGPMRAERIVVEGGNHRLELPRLVIEGYAERRLRGLELAGLTIEGPAGERAELNTAGLAGLDFFALDATAWNAADDPVALMGLIDRLRLEGLRLGGLAIGWSDGSLGVDRLGLARAGQGGIEAFTLEGFRVAEGADRRAELGRLAVERIDWSRIRLDRLAEAAGFLAESARSEHGGEEEPADEQPAAEDAATEGAAGAEPEASDQPADPGLARSFAGLALLGELLRLEIGSVGVEGLAAGGSDGGLELARLAWDGLREGRLGAILVTGFGGRGSEGKRLALDRFEQTAMTIGPADLADRVEKAARTPEAFQALMAELSRLPWQARTTIAGFALSRDGATGFGIERLSSAFDEEESRKRVSLTLDGLVVDPVVLGVADAEEARERLGSGRLDLRARLVTLYDQASRDLRIEELAVDSAGQAAVALKLAARLGADPAADPVTASTDAELLRAELTFRDQGLVERWLAKQEREARRNRTEIVKELLRDLRSGEPGRSLLDSKRAGELEKFLIRPRTLVVRLAPPKPVSFLAAFLGTMVTPGQTAQTLGLTIEARDR